MNEAQIKGNWKQIVGKLQEEFGNLTDADIEKSTDQNSFIDVLAARYKIDKAAAKEKFNDYMESFGEDAKNQLAKLKKKVADLSELVGEKTKEVAEKGKEVVKNHPVATVGTVLALGALVGWLICRSGSK